MRPGCALLFVAWTLMALFASCGEKRQEASAFQQAFDSAALVEECRSRFGEVREAGHRSWILITPPGHEFCDFRIEGKIPPAQLSDLETLLESRLVALAGKTGAEIVKVHADVSDRPAAVRTAVLATDKSDPGNLRGFWFQYECDGVTGFVDVMATPVTEGEESFWRLGCAVHEPVGADD